MNSKNKRMINLSFLCFCLLLFIVSCSGIKNILGLSKSSDSKETIISQFLSNMRPQPGNPDSHYLLACHYQERGRHKEAIEEFRKVLLIEPTYVKAYNGIGVSNDLLGDFHTAIKYYKMALSLNPNLDYIYNNLGYSYLLQGNLDDAITALEKAIVINGQDQRFHNNLGLAYGEKGQYDLALTEFKLASDEAKAQHNMAQIYFKKGLLDEAKIHYAIALKLNPSLTVVRTALKAADALARIFEPIPGKVEPKQLIVPDQPKEMAKIENLNVSSQLTTMEMEPMEGINNNQPHLLSLQISEEEMTFSNQQPKLKEASSTYNISEEDKKLVIDIEKVKKVAEKKEIKKEEAVNGETMEAPPVAPAKHSAPEKARKAKEIVDVSLEDRKDSIIYNIVADGKIGDYDVFKLDFPSRLVLDIRKMGNHYAKTGIWFENPFIKVVRIGHYPDKMRFVFDSLSPQLPPYQVNRIDHKLMVSFGNIPQPGEPKIDAKETRSPEKEASSVSTKTPFETSRNGKIAIEISNGNGVDKMARMVGDYLKEKGFRVTRLTNANYFNYAETKIFYQKEYHDAADQVAEQLPVFWSKEETEKFDRPNIKIKILIGKDLVPHHKTFENGKKS
jgi:tetratricopeptide (TPR) repeat protein